MTTSSDPGFDPRLADWFEADPHRAPEPILEVVVAAIPSITQRQVSRRPWRFPIMTTTSKLAIGAAAAITIVAAGALILGPLTTGDVGGGSGSTPGSTAGRTSAPEASASAEASIDSRGLVTFVSDAYRYRVQVPAGWIVQPATNVAAFDGPPTFPDGFDRTTMDLYEENPVDRMWVASTPIAPASDLDDWIYDHLRARHGVGGGQCGTQSAQQWRQRTVADHPARWRSVCGYFDVVIVAADRVYVVSARSGAMVDTLLATIDFQP
jgi:hypothetical protein